MRIYKYCCLLQPPPARPPALRLRLRYAPTPLTTTTTKQRRKNPVRLRALMLGYNTLNVCISLFVACSLLFFKIASRGFDGGGGGMGVGGDVSALSIGGLGGFVCNPLRTDAQGQRVARVFAVFYLQKYLELVDTFLFVLRRSFRQVQQQLVGDESSDSRGWRMRLRLGRETHIDAPRLPVLT